MPADLAWRMSQTERVARGVIGLAVVTVALAAASLIPLLRADVLPTPPPLGAFVPTLPPVAVAPAPQSWLRSSEDPPAPIGQEDR